MLPIPTEPTAVVVVPASGVLDQRRCEPLLERLNSAVRNGCRELELDCGADVDPLSAGFIGQLLVLGSGLRERGGELRIRCRGRWCLDLLRFLDVERLVRLIDAAEDGS
ncbi:MAG: STAS domain-containing protein [Planctomycetota bacterium]